MRPSPVGVPKPGSAAGNVESGTRKRDMKEMSKKTVNRQINEAVSRDEEETHMSLTANVRPRRRGEDWSGEEDGGGRSRSLLMKAPKGSRFGFSAMSRSAAASPSPSLPLVPPYPPPPACPAKIYNFFFLIFTI